MDPAARKVDCTVRAEIPKAAAGSSTPGTEVDDEGGFAVEQHGHAAGNRPVGLAARAGSAVVRIDSGHSPFLSRPQETADIIDAAGR